MKRLVALLVVNATLPAAGGAEHLRYRLNGLDVDATHARGAEARVLVERFIETLPRAPSQDQPGWIVRGSWRQIGTLQGDLSRVLQVRGEGEQLEAIASEFDTRQAPRAEVPSPLGTPPAATLASQLHFQRPSASSQWVYRSAWRPTVMNSWLRVAASVRGWNIDASSANGELSLHRKADRLDVMVLPEARSGRGSVIVMTARSVP